MGSDTPTDASAAEPGSRSSACSTSRGLWTTGTAVTDPLAAGREVILFESAGIGRSSGKVPETSRVWPSMRRRSSMASASAMRRPRLFAGRHGRATDGTRPPLDLPPDDPRRHRSAWRRGHYAPRQARLAQPLSDPNKGYAVLQESSSHPSRQNQEAGAAFIERLMQRKEDREPASGPNVAQAQQRRSATRNGSMESASPPETHPATRLGRKRHPRRDDPGAQLVLAK